MIIILDHAGVYYRMSTIRPSCFGNAVEYDAYRNSCTGCAHRLDCAQEIQRIQAKLRAPVSNVPPPSPPPTQTYYSGVRPQSPPPTYYSAPTASPAAPLHSQYDFTAPVPEQFGAYLGFSFLDVLCRELQHLVGAARNDYISKRRKP